ncbi:MiaB/RimO family radical SAM methylthiotransferase [bacterium]|jgi:tRNA-2-methylthio-N6-dimethylallyladenosine synthase|nr:MiaB/RimO family radical SAM methylthiotransferase [Verrucomicrobiota bacterium]MDA7503228.1 MiaB/RimO family radical SAM methylthiotransferase [bacterium]MDA7507293.1 MiaB/RimO family radical SAM methylthiotransferase [Akkermansiaceae bacterium]MBT6398579.1 MiaB/RimO family radical SAM methylthiotransferase [Verrucomicrobiota bacterium]MBT7214296.1 MiaB/RimO family radical SAM methylthiotransferase [Verrucomicrobiota bacterium]
MNERDSEQVAQTFAERGYTLTPKEQDADAILINTCSVRDQAEQKALGKMGMMGKYRESRDHVVYGFMGCMAQSRGSELFERVPHLDLVVGTQKYHRVFDYVDSILNRRLQTRMDEVGVEMVTGRVEDEIIKINQDRIISARMVDTEEEEGSQNTIRDHIPREGQQATSFVSIMQGCNMRCSFCIVPDTRGKERGRPISDIVSEVRDLVGKGVKEVTLLGQIVNLYGRTEFPIVDGKSPFVQLLEAVHEIEGLERIRFTSPHPIGYRDDLVEAFTYLPKLCSHIHFPMQSGSDRILKKMRRPYKNEKFLTICEKMQAARPDLAITTDVIVGFPGETEEDFEETVACMKRIGFDNSFIFRYSKRKDTPAAEMDEQLSDKVKEARNQILLRIQEQLTTTKNAKLIGTVQQVLCEGPSKTNKKRLSGRTSQNKIVIFDGNAERMAGQLLDVRIEDSTGYTLYGTPEIH